MYKNTIKTILEHIQLLSDNSFPVEISWTPGHSSVQGNEIADRLAKEAAKEACTLPESSVIVTHSDVKQAARRFVTEKWQHRWDLSNVGRQFYELQPNVDSKLYQDIPSKKSYNRIMKLRLGCCLNNYRSKIDSSHSSECSCGTRETVQHFLLDCTNFESHRATLEKTLRERLGVMTLDVTQLLGYANHEVITNWRELLLTDLAEFIDQTGRFTANASVLGDHTETVDIEFDPHRTSYEKLLDCFWKWHNPTVSHSRQYMSAIFFHNDNQRQLAETSKQEHQKHIARPIATKITPALPFYNAEDYHQKYLLRQHTKVLDSLKLSDEELIKSKVACRLNGYVGGFGSEEEFMNELAELQLSESVAAYVKKQIQKKGGF